MNDMNISSNDIPLVNYEDFFVRDGDDYVITTSKDVRMAKLGRRKIVHIHMHSIFSVADAMIKPYEVAKRASELGIEVIILTDHGVISGAIQMKKACEAFGIKFIPACELYEAPGGIKADRKQKKHPQTDNRHITIIPVNDRGWSDLQFIIQDANMSGFYYNPRTDMNFIKRNDLGKNLIATSGCLGSQISNYLMNGMYEEAKQEIEFRKTIFHTFFLEIQDNGSKDQEIVNAQLIKLGLETNTPLVYAKDVHYLFPEHNDPHHGLVAISRKTTIHECCPYPGENTYHFAGPEEVYQWGLDNVIPVEAFLNTALIGELCNVTIELGKKLMPEYPYIEDGHTPSSYLHKLAIEELMSYIDRLSSKGKSINVKTYLDRLHLELETIKSFDVASYFLILWDILMWSSNRKKWLTYKKNAQWINDVSDLKETVISNIDETGKGKRKTVFEPVLPNKKYETYPDYFLGPGRGKLLPPCEVIRM